MYAVFTKLLNMSLTASILVLFVILLRFVLKKAPKKYICILWAIVALRLICPFSISSPFSAYNMLHQNTVSTGQVEYFEYNEKTEKPALIFEVPALVNDSYSPNSMTIGTKTSDIYMPTAIYIWGLGMIVMLIYAAVCYYHLRKEVRASIKKTDNIYVCDEINSPFILGIIRPRIYLPSGINEEVKGNVVAHEKAHIKRFDHLWKPLGFLLLSVYWFNPLMWVAYVFLCKDIEAACDEKVISQMDKERIASYSESLLSCASQRRMITACPVAFGETNVKGRIKNVLNYKKPAFWIICISLIVCIVVAVCFLTNPKKNNNEDIEFGTYVKNDGTQDPMLYWSGLTINEDGTFSFSPSVISSYIGTGTWKINGDCVIFSDIGMGDVQKEVFRYADGNLYYVEDMSSTNSMWELTDGTEFVLNPEYSYKEVSEKNEDLNQLLQELHESESSTVSDEAQSSEYVGIKTNLFEEMSGEYWMLSGTGGWQSRIYLYNDGYFVGLFEDGDAGSIDRCEFSGLFQAAAYMNENTYITHIENLVYEETGKISEEDGIKVTTSTPYGFEGTSTTYIYAPGTPISSLSNNEYFWLSAEREEFWDKGYEKAKNDLLPCFAIRNIDANNLSEVDYMFTKIPERYQSDLGLKRTAGTGNGNSSINGLISKYADEQVDNIYKEQGKWIIQTEIDEITSNSAKIRYYVDTLETNVILWEETIQYEYDMESINVTSSDWNYYHFISRCDSFLSAYNGDLEGTGMDYSKNTKGERIKKSYGFNDPIYSVRKLLNLCTYDEYVNLSLETNGDDTSVLISFPKTNESVTVKMIQPWEDSEAWLPWHINE